MAELIEIQKSMDNLKDRLHFLLNQRDDFSDPEVLKTNMELDKVINKYYNLVSRIHSN